MFTVGWAGQLDSGMVMNSWKADGAVNLPWRHESVKVEVIATIRPRYTRMPCMWAQLERDHREHHPIILPTAYTFPDDEQYHAGCDDFMPNDALLAAPVLG